MLTIKQLLQEREDALRIKDDLNKAKYAVLSVLVGELQRKDKDPTEAVIVAKVKKMIDDLNFSLEHRDLPHLKLEIKILEKYIPTQLTEAEVNKLLIRENCANLGLFMKFMKAQHAGLYDGRMVSTLAKDFYS